MWRAGFRADRRLLLVVYAVAAAALFRTIGRINRRAALRLEDQITDLDRELLET